MNKLINYIKAIAISLTCSFLGAWAGVEGTNKNWRRFFIPILKGNC